MELTGKIIVVQEAKSGSSSKTGKPWMMQEYVIEVPGQYPRHCAFTVFGEDRIKQMNIQNGEDHNGKWYNVFRAYNVIRGQQIPQPIQPAKDDLPFYPNSESFPFQENGNDGSGLPF